MKTPKREVDLVVISDVHLGTYGCHAQELLKYLKSIKPKKVIRIIPIIKAVFLTLTEVVSCQILMKTRIKTKGPIKIIDA